MEESYDPYLDPSLVTLPVELSTLVGTSVDTYSRPWRRSIADHPTNNHEKDKGGDEVCAVCLDKLDSESKWDKQARELIHSCRHVFHKGCLDGWVGRGQWTCPVCRARLLGDQKEAPRKDVESGWRNWDPWRAERMIYLFGEDVSF